MNAARRHLRRPRWLRESIWQAARSWSWARNGWRSPPPAAWTIATRTRFDDSIEPFLHQATRQFEFARVRTTDWLNWRFCDPRGGPFTVRVADMDGRVLGYVAFVATAERAAVADLLALPGRVDVAESLVRDALEAMRRAGAGGVRCWLPRRHPYAPVFRRLGFLRPRGREGPHFFVRVRGYDADEFAFLTQSDARIHVMLGDFDHV
jgi:hypothetical protein